MTLNKKQKYLRIPLYKLYYIDDINQFNGLSVSELNQLEHDYTEQELEDITNALIWAKENPEFDFSSLLPGLRHSNNDIKEYINIIFEQII